MLAGLDEVDAVFFEFANAIESNIRTGRSGRFFRFNDYLHRTLRDIAEIRSKAIDVALSLTSGAYQTSLVSYFAHRDLFPALMKVCVNAVLCLWSLPVIISIFLGRLLSFHLQ